MELARTKRETEWSRLLLTKRRIFVQSLTKIRRSCKMRGQMVK